MKIKKIVFLTGTRADFSKLKSLIRISQNSNNYEVHIFATGMHMNAKYGKTIDEIYKAGFKKVYPFINHDTIEHMDRTLSKTIDGFSHFISELNPDLIIVHGDRVEALSGAIVGSLNNILVAHIEGGEVSGTIDELIRHSVSKLSHIHLVANEDAKKRLIQLGEYQNSIHILGSPDLDLMNPKQLPKYEDVCEYYDVKFQDYSIAVFHPITTDYKQVYFCIKEFVDALIGSELNYIVIYPNNDLGSNEILNEYKKIEDNKRFKIFPSLRFEYFLTLLKNSEFIIGNSSSGIREAPFYNIPTIDIGTRQKNRANSPSIFHSGYEKIKILKEIQNIKNYKNTSKEVQHYYGNGKSDVLFLELLNSDKFWKISCQKQFQDLK
ncbi:MAG: UDP-N-acetylglucosamine 2-epimerase (hydrolyzing) [Candidatus Delongbacteria bacterium]|nr:UDP-N-acetylglucosamine 2-epimerase (hydrolyzing) [Candidatus Delongbacteria bacterium]